MTVPISDFDAVVIRLVSFTWGLQHHFPNMPKTVFTSNADGKLIVSEEFSQWLIKNDLAAIVNGNLKIEYDKLNLYSIYGHNN